MTVMFYVRFTWTQSNRILKSHFPEEAAASVEAHLVSQRTTIGGAWEPDKEDNPHPPQVKTSGSGTDSPAVTATSSMGAVSGSEVVYVGGENVDNNVIPNPRLGEFTA